MAGSQIQFMRSKKGFWKGKSLKKKGAVKKEVQL